MFKDDFPLASRFALGCDTTRLDRQSVLANRRRDSVALSAARPKSPSSSSSSPSSPLQSIVYFLFPSFCPKSALRRKRRTRDIDAGRSKPASYRETLEEIERMYMCVCVEGCRNICLRWNPSNRCPIWRKCDYYVTPSSPRDVFPFHPGKISIFDIMELRRNY